MKPKLFAFLFIVFAYAVQSLAQPKVIAHRGYWSTKGSAQNSITGLIKADKINCYGSEFDVWITADDQLVVNHDPTYNKVNLQYSNYETDVKPLKLSNGENLPLLRDFLTKAKSLKAKLILEIKAHKEKERTMACVDKTLELIKELGLEGRVTYISFSYQACLALKQKAPAGTESYYLGGNIEPGRIKRDGLDGIDYNGKILRETHPEWIEQCHNLGLKVNVWTIDDPEQLQYFIEHNVDFITTNEPVVLQKLLKKKKK